MIDNSEMEAIKKGWMPIMMIWASMFASLVIYVVICHILAEQMTFTADETFPYQTLKYALFGAAVFILLLSSVIHRSMLNSGKPLPPQTGAAQPHHPAVGKYLTAMLISLAMSEAVGIFGLVLFFLSRDFSSLYFFVILSACAMYRYRPKKYELVRLAETMKQFKETTGTLQP